MKEYDNCMDSEYTNYLKAHPIEWIDDFIRKDLIHGKEVFVENEMIWIVVQIGKRLQEKFWDWVKELNSPLRKFDEDNFYVFLEWRAAPAYYDTFGVFHEPDVRGWYFKVKMVAKNQNNQEE